jgi:2-polyprenyl-6-methoxyphenol hydroxylase-like FAD-dependent oxidoreductase
MIDFLIAGGGIGGAVLARLLARQDKTVLVLERETSPRHVVRPEVLWPATVRTLEGMLTSLDPAEWRLPLQGLRIFYGSRVLTEIDQAALQKAGVTPNSSDPNVTRTSLLTDPAFEIRRGVELVELIRNSERVCGARIRDTATGTVSEIESQCVVGDDGANSLVRRGCGIDLRIHKLPVELACFEFDWPAALPAGIPHVVLNPRGSSQGVAVMGGIPLPQGRGIALIVLRWPQAQNTAVIQDSLRQLKETDSPVAGLIGPRQFPDDFAHFRPQFGHAARYGIPGAVLLGDAAHPVTPAGGQGANMAIADAVALADCIKENPGDFLAAYEHRRRKANGASVSISRSVAWGFKVPRWLFDFLAPRLVRWFGRNPSWGLQRFATSFRDTES